MKDEDLEQMNELMQNLHFPDEETREAYLEKVKRKKVLKSMKEPEFVNPLTWRKNNSPRTGPNRDEIYMKRMNELGIYDNTQSTFYNGKDMGKLIDILDDEAVYENGRIPLEEFERGNVHQITFDPGSAYVKEVGKKFNEKLSVSSTIGGRKPRSKTRRRRTMKRRKQFNKSSKRRR
jgi:hypothetical protein